MGLTRAQHYQVAGELLAPITSRIARSPDHAPVLTASEKERLAVAQVHATLASAPREVAGE